MNDSYTPEELLHRVQTRRPVGEYDGEIVREVLEEMFERVAKAESASKDIKVICGAAMKFFLLTMTTVQVGVQRLKAENDQLKQVIQQMGQSK
jgi:hypothetical protein